jgi:hypothetical protein
MQYLFLGCSAAALPAAGRGFGTGFVNVMRRVCVGCHMEGAAADYLIQEQESSLCAFHAQCSSYNWGQ